MDVVIADEAISELKITDKVANARAGDYYSITTCVCGFEVIMEVNEERR